MTAEMLYAPIAENAARLGHHIVGGVMDAYTAFAACGCCSEVCIGFKVGTRNLQVLVDSASVTRCRLA
jgi:hypothetical protein